MYIKIGSGTYLKSRWSSLLLTHVSMKSELILRSKPCPNFRVGHVCNRDYSSKFGAAGKAEKIDLDEYISRLESEGKQDRVEKPKKLWRLKLRE